MSSAATFRSLNAYRSISVETSMHTIDQHQIVNLLLDGLLQSLATARGAIARGDIPGKCSSISRAIRILEEGLSTGLDRVDGGELAERLAALYDYCIHQLVVANLHSSDQILQEVQNLMEPIAQSWKAIQTPLYAHAPAPAAPSAKLSVVGA